MKVADIQYQPPFFNYTPGKQNKGRRQFGLILFMSTK